MIAKEKIHGALVHRLYRIDNWVAERYETWPRPVRAAYERFDEQWVARKLCAVLGHKPEPDQCLLPEHDLCVWCLSSMPFQAPGVPTRLLRRLHYRLDDAELSARITAKLGDDGLNLRGRHG